MIARETMNVYIHINIAYKYACSKRTFILNLVFIALKYIYITKCIILLLNDFNALLGNLKKKFATHFFIILKKILIKL